MARPQYRPLASAASESPPRASFEHRTSHDTSPHTPPLQLGRARGRGAPRVRPSIRDAFEEHAKDGTPETNARRGPTHTRQKSSAHDLSWSPRHGRDSVVDHMLNSLEQLGEMPTAPPHAVMPNRALFREEHVPEGEEEQYLDAYEGVDHGDAFGDIRRYASGPGRMRAHTHALSVSSGCSARTDSINSPKAQGRRSNSNPACPSALGRVGSTCSAGAEDSSFAWQAPQPQDLSTTKQDIAGDGGTSARTGRRRRSSSPDFTQRRDSAPWQQNRNRRSASFDHSYNQSTAMRPTHLPPAIPSGDHSLLYAESDAAPNPTVPAGPRRGQSPPPSPYRPNSSVSTSRQTVNRRGSLRAPFSIFGRSDKDQITDHRASKITPRVTHTRNNSGGEATGPAQRTPIKPSDTRTPLNTSSAMPSSTTKERERPGFFRRVFRSSRNTTLTRADLASTTHKAALQPNPGESETLAPRASNEQKTNDSVDRPAGQRASSRERQLLKQQPCRDLNKKSSFFRRRRKSIVEPAPVPTVSLPSDLKPLGQPLLQSRNDTAPTKPLDSSPPSSLRNVMNPYLAEAATKGREVQSDHPRLNSHSTSKSQADVQLDEPEEAALPGQATPDAGLGRNHNAGARLRQGSADRASERCSNEIRRTSGPNGHSRVPSDVHKDLPALPSETNMTDESKRSYMRQTPTKPVALSYEVADRPSPGARQLQQGTREDSARPKLRRLSTAPDVVNESARASGSTLSDYKSASSKIHSPVPDGDIASAVFEAPNDAPIKEQNAIDGSIPLISDATCPSTTDHILAAKLLAGQADDVSKADTVAHLGAGSIERARVRHAFLELFGWRDASILSALRDFCTRVPLRGETQQVDRVLDAIARRWCVCNPQNGFQAADVVHTICYSLLLLNTDLHLADIENRMTRQQFIRNTMPTIRRVVMDAAPEAFELGRSSMLPPSKSQMLEPVDPQATIKASSGVMDALEKVDSTQDHSRRVDAHRNDCGPLVKQPFHGKMITWETQIEAVLRSFYQSIRQERLPLHGTSEGEPPMPSQPSSAGLSAMGSMLRRTNSMLSKAGSETFPRGRLESRGGTGGANSPWSIKARSRPRLYPPSTAHSHTSLDGDDGYSAISPSGSSLWSSSKFSLGKTQTSMSVGSYASNLSSRGGDYQQSIGFANALSQAIIREEAAGTGEDSRAEDGIRAAPLLEDESLELAGAPWAKEGLIKHKRHLEAADRRARDRTWTDCFAVIEKGCMRLFQFQLGTGTRSLRHKNRATSSRHQSTPMGQSGNSEADSGPIVGGGNWLDNAQQLDQFPLRHILASALPPPGYSKARPHVWALSLPTGAVHLFQAGTGEIVKEFVTAANYWSARLSKEPLIGGVSNMEYGWSERIINLALTSQDSRPPSTAPSAGGASAPRPSLQSSIRSSFDQSVGGARPRLPGDKVHLGDWSPPSQSMLASQLLEVDQLKALIAYVRNVEEELRKHNELRGAILLAVSDVSI